MGSVEGAQSILSGLKEAGVDLVASVPDINVLELINLLYESRDITHIPVGREEEGRPHTEDGQIRIDPLGAILREDRDPVPRLDAQIQKPQGGVLNFS